MKVREVPIRARVQTAAAVEEPRCAHCGLPSQPSSEGCDAFCCSACEMAYDIIHGCGLTRYYELAKLSGRDPLPAMGKGSSYAEFDHAALVERYAHKLPQGLMRVELSVRGIHCAACVWLIERLPQLLPGVTAVSASAPTARVSVTWDPSQIALSEIARRLDRLGYAVRFTRENHADRARHRSMMIRVGVAGAIAGNVMIASVALYGGVFSGIEPQFAMFFRWVSFVLALVAVAGPGRVFIRSAFTALRVGVAHIDIPVALGLSVGLVAGAVNTIRNTGDVYFDTVCVLVFLLLTGRWIQECQQHKVATALELLGSVTPTSAHRKEGARVEQVPVEVLTEGDEIEVYAGESIPVDGRVVEGTSYLDLSVLSGESHPVHVLTGDQVPAGATNLSSPITVAVERTGVDTRLGRLMELIASAAERKAPVVRLADHIAGRFVLIVVALALLTFVIWLFIDATKASSAAVALLIVTCPCALALATPLAVMVGIRRAAGRSILIKGGDTLEALSGTGTLILDKTGTITAGQCEVVNWVGDPSICALVAAIERHSNHPIALALVRYCADESILRATQVESVLGAGVHGYVEGRHVHIGSERFIRESRCRLPKWAQEAATEFAHAGGSPVMMSVDGDVRALASIGDAVRVDAKQSIALLKRAGWQVMLCSGDRSDIVRSVAVQVGIRLDEALGDCTPERKLELIREIARQRRVVMVGDGVNDAAALAEATVGVAVHGGAEASMHAADVYLARPGLGALVELIDGARATMRIIRLNLGVSLGYNVVCASLAVTGLITPLIAAILMPVSSITVISISRSMRSFGGLQR